MAFSFAVGTAQAQAHAYEIQRKILGKWRVCLAKKGMDKPN